MKSRKILIPLDGSSMAEAALPKAVELVKQNGPYKLVLLRAVDPTTLLVDRSRRPTKRPSTSGT